MKTFPLKYCCIDWTATGCVTTFDDGRQLHSYPHDTAHYSVISHRCGYGDDLLSYCREHDFVHAFLCEMFHDTPSPVLWALAHDNEEPHSAIEEVFVQTFQRWLRANERPIVGGVDWDILKRLALKQLAS